jgi:NitT/TauT family transport system substrate-binding protein
VITRRLVTGLLCALSLFASAGCFSVANGTVYKITMGYGSFPGWLPWKVAEEQGIFKNNGIDVQLKYFSSISDGNNAMASGALDANNQTLNDTLSALSGGSRPQKIVLVNDTSTGANQIIARAGISSVADLRGKKVAVEEGIVDYYFLLLVLQDAHLSLDDIDLELQGTDSATAAFVGGKVDAVVSHLPFTTTALKRKDSRAVATTAEYPNACSDNLVVSQDMAKTRPDAVQALVNSWFQTLNWIKAHREEANAILAKQAGVNAKDYDSYTSGLTMLTLQQNIDEFTPGVTTKNLNFQANDIADFIVDAGISQQRPSVDGLLDGRFVKAASQ